LRSLAVAVIARESADVGQCLAALGRAGADTPRVERIGPDGPAMARNRALSACEAEVLALVEDDVLVDPGWLEALTTTWEAAEPRLACLGGPLRASFAAGRPAWLSDDLVDAFATLDFGDRTALVDARRGTFHGGNVSFRANALRGVGGLWPARGHPDGRDWFSEEHEAQRELARAGWTARYVPGVAATRLVRDDVSRAAVLRRRLRYGARQALIGERRPRHMAARQLVTSALGVPVALVHGRQRRAMERAVRVAQSAGALLAGPLAHRDLQPVVRDTPFRSGVPAPQPRRARRRPRRRASPVILLYHRVVERDRDPLGVCVSPANLAAQLDVLRAERELVPLDQILGGDVPPSAAAVTFDDGYRDNLEAAAPALAAAGVPATLFVATGPVAKGDGFWWDELERILRTATGRLEPVVELSLSGQRRAFRVAEPGEREVARGHLQRWLQPMAPAQIRSALRELRSWARLPESVDTPEEDRPMTPEEVRAFADTPRLSIGAHGRSHRSLRHADAGTQDAEIAGSRDDIVTWLGSEPTCFSYPFGFPGADFDDAVMARVRAAGFSLGVTTAPGSIRSADRLALPRSAVPDLDGNAFHAWLCGRQVVEPACPPASSYRRSGGRA
jgi:peptidoglycan/xylan/chitin deacetylase (PgdA/CDA1 family)